MNGMPPCALRSTGLLHGSIAGTAGTPAGLDVFLGIEVSPPAVDHRAADLGGWVGGLDGQRRANAAVGHFVISEGQRVHIDVVRIPPGGLVVQVVDGHACAVAGIRISGAELVHQVIDPTACPGVLRPGGIHRGGCGWRRRRLRDAGDGRDRCR